MAALLVIDVETAFLRAALRVDTGAFPVTVLFGPSGAGKTTLLRCLAGLDRPARGRVQFGADTWFDAAAGVMAPPQGRRVGYVSQHGDLFPHLTVAGNLGYGLGHLAPSRRRERVAELLALLGLGEFAARRPDQLSGGQQQRVALARALAGPVRLLLLDEPMAALDAPARVALRAELRRVLRAQGVPAVLVTHDRVEALALGDHVAVMDAGAVRQSGPVGEVFGRPADPTVARIVGVETVVPARVVASEGGLATVSVGGVRLVALDPGCAGAEVWVCIRAEDVTLEVAPTTTSGAASSAASSARNHLRGRVVALSPEGPLTRVTLDCGFPLVALVTRQSCEEFGWREGATVTAAIKASVIQVVEAGGGVPAHGPIPGEAVVAPSAS